MPWVVVVESTPADKLEAAIPTIAELSKGTEVIIRIDLPWYAPLGKLADLAGAEWWARWLIGGGFIIDDVYGDWHWMEIKGRADPIWLVALLPLIVKALIAIVGAAALAFITVQIRAMIVEPKEIAKEREAAKIDFFKRYEPIYGGEAVYRWIEGIESPPPEVKVPDILKPVGIGLGVLLIAGLVLFALARK